MNFSNFYIRSVMTKLELESYTEVMRIIGGSESLMSMIRKEQRTLSHSQVIEISEILKIDEGVILAGMMADKSKTEKEREAWLKLIKGYKNLPKALVEVFAKKMLC